MVFDLHPHGIQNEKGQYQGDRWVVFRIGQTIIMLYRMSHNKKSPHRHYGPRLTDGVAQHADGRHPAFGP